MKRLLVMLTSVGIIFSAAQSMAMGSDGFYAALGLAPVTQKYEVDPIGGIEFSTTYNNLNLGWGFGGFYLGLGLGLSSGDFQLNNTGLAVGYMGYTGFQALLTYFPIVNIKLDGASTEYTEGSGFKVELNKVFELGSSVGLGFGIVYDSLTTTETESPDAEVDIDWTFMYPQIILAASF